MYASKKNTHYLKKKKLTKSPKAMSSQPEVPPVKVTEDLYLFR